MSAQLLMCLLFIKLSLVLSQSDKAGIYAIGGLELLVNTNYIIEAALVKYDPASANVTILHESAYNWTEGSKACFDHKNHIWYFLYEQFYLREFPELYLARYNIETDKRLPDVSIEKYFRSINTVDCVGDKDGNIYFFGNKRNENKTRLMKVVTDSNNDITFNDIKDYNFTLVFNAANSLFKAVGPIYDSKRNMAWFNAAIYNPPPYVDYLWYYINLTNGQIMNVIEDAHFPMDRSAIYDVEIDQVVGLNWDRNATSDGKRHYILEYADPLTLNISKKLGPQLVEYCPIVLRSPAIDDNKQIFYEFMTAPMEIYEPYSNCFDAYLGLVEFHLVGVNIKNGQIVTQPKIGRHQGLNWINSAPYDLIYWDGN